MSETTTIGPWWLVVSAGVFLVGVGVGTFLRGCAAVYCEWMGWRRGE